MLQTPMVRWSLVLTLAGALLASPASAQKKRDKKDDRGRERPELVRRTPAQSAKGKAARDRAAREHDRVRVRRDGQRVILGGGWDDPRERRRDVPPGWCRGKGNPHNTPENCGYGVRRDRRWDDDDRDWGDRYEDRDRSRSRERYGSYREAHEEFHRWHDRECKMRLAERPLDISWQIRVRQECKQRHDDWHYRMGRRHQ